MAEQKVEAVERALAVLDAFSDGAKRLSLSELNQKTGLYPSTILRLAGSLERFGYLHREQGGAFRLGATVSRLGRLYDAAFDLAGLVRPVLHELMLETEETAAFYVREGEHRVCLYREHAMRSFRYNVDEGATLPLDRGASARILMAYSGQQGGIYEDIRREGFYISRGERDPEAAAVAVPVFGPAEELVGALGVVGTHARLDESARSHALAALQAAATRLEADLKKDGTGPHHE